MRGGNKKARAGSDNTSQEEEPKAGNNPTGADKGKAKQANVDGGNEGAIQQLQKQLQKEKGKGRELMREKPTEEAEKENQKTQRDRGQGNTQILQRKVP